MMEGISTRLLMPEFKKGQCLACFKGNERDRRVPTSGRKVA